MRKCLDWLVALFGFAVGVFVIGLLANTEKPSGEWAAVVTMVVFGVGPLVASILALHNRKLAAHVFFIGMVLGAICVVWAWMLARSHEVDVRLSMLLLFLAIVFFLTGTFWLLTDRKKWPPLVQRGFTLRLRLMFGLGIFSMLLFGAVASGLYAAARMPGFGDCGEPRPFASPESAEHTAFTARIVYVHEVSTYTGWSIARVQKRYWGLPWWNQRFVILPYKFFKPGDSYLVDGHVRPSLVGSFINLMYVHCSRTAPVRDAQVDLRLLRDGPPQKGVRIIGRVLKWQAGYGSQQVAPHVNVTIIRGDGPRVATVTDALGIYDASGLPPGHYEVRLDSCTGRNSFGCTCGQPSEDVVEEGHVWGCTLRVPFDEKSK